MQNRREFLKRASLMLAGGMVMPQLLTSCAGKASASESSKYIGRQLYSLRELVKEEGPDHNKSFEVCVKIGDEEIGRGLGRTKKAAEQVAAAEEEAKKTLADATAEAEQKANVLLADSEKVGADIKARAASTAEFTRRRTCLLYTSPRPRDCS